MSLTAGVLVLGFAVDITVRKGRFQSLFPHTGQGQQGQGCRQRGAFLRCLLFYFLEEGEGRGEEGEEGRTGEGREKWEGKGGEGRQGRGGEGGEVCPAPAVSAPPGFNIRRDMEHLSYHLCQ